MNKFFIAAMSFFALSMSGCADRSEAATRCLPETNKFITVKASKEKFTFNDRSMRIEVSTKVPMTDVKLTITITKIMPMQEVFVQSKQLGKFDNSFSVNWDFIRQDTHKFAADGKYRVTVEGTGMVQMRRDLCANAEFELARRK